MLIPAVVLLGVAAVLPLALGHPRRWVVAAVAVAIALAMPVGPAAAVVASIWLLVSLVGLVELLPSVRDTGWRLIHTDEALAHVAATGFAAVAAVALVASRAGLTLFGIGEPIVQLTAVHFVYAGVGAVVLAGSVAPSGRAGRMALFLTVSAPPVVATGFVLQHPVPQVGGAVLMSVGVLSTAALQLREATIGGQSHRWHRPLLVVSGLAPWIPMGLAVAWAASLYWDVPALSIPDMARTHGVMNVVFVLAGLVARRYGARAVVEPVVGVAAPVRP